MTLRRRRSATVLAVVLALQLGAIAAVLASNVGTASAHAGVVGTDPSDGGSVPTAPATVSVTFTESVSTSAGGLVVRDSKGARVDDGSSTARGAVLSVGLRPDLPDGTYVATYRVLSADAHPVSGSFLFGVGSGDLDRSLAGADGDGLWELIGDFARGGLLVAALLATGSALFLGFIHDGAEDRWRIVPFVRIGTIVAFLAAIGMVMAQAALLTGRGAGASTDTAVLRTVLSGDLGRSLAVLLVGLVVVHLSTDVPNRTVSRVLALYGGLAVTVSFALWGHATNLTPSWLLMGADAVHATAAAVWFGGLVGLSMVLSMRDATTVRSTAAIVGRFSTAAAWSVLALVVAGLGLAVAGSDGSWHALVTSTWGRLVLLKVALTGSVLLIAWWNRRRLVPSIVHARHDGAVGQERDRSRLLRAVRLEAIVIVGVLAVTAVLTNQTPARDAITASSAGFSSTRSADSGPVELVVRPARVGPNAFTVTFTSATGQPADVGNTMAIEFSLPSEGLAPIVRRTDAVSTGRFEYEGPELSMPGVWTVTVAVRTGVFAEQRTSFEVRVEP